MRHHWISSILVALLISGCGSTPRSNYYMLSAEASGSPGGEGPSIGVGPITVPDYLKRKEMVLNRDANRLELAEYDRWAESLDAGILRVTALNLAALLETQQVQRFPWRRAGIPDYGVSVAVVQFSVNDANALLVAEWASHSPLGQRSAQPTHQHPENPCPQLGARRCGGGLQQATRQSGRGNCCRHKKGVLRTPFRSHSSYS